VEELHAHYTPCNKHSLALPVYDGTKDSTTSACKLVGTYFGTTLENDAVMELANLKEPESGWLIDDTLELHCTVMSEDAPKFSLETGTCGAGVCITVAL